MCKTLCVLGKKNEGKDLKFICKKCKRQADKKKKLCKPKKVKVT